MTIQTSIPSYTKTFNPIKFKKHPTEIPTIDKRFSDFLPNYFMTNFAKNYYNISRLVDIHQNVTPIKTPIQNYSQKVILKHIIMEFKFQFENLEKHFVKKLNIFEKNLLKTLKIRKLTRKKVLIGCYNYGYRYIQNYLGLRKKRLTLKRVSKVFYVKLKHKMMLVKNKYQEKKKEYKMGLLKSIEYRTIKKWSNFIYDNTKKEFEIIKQEFYNEIFKIQDEIIQKFRNTFIRLWIPTNKIK